MTSLPTVVVPPPWFIVVRRRKSLFTRADQLETRPAAARRRADVLTRSLLARAFAGKLVPRDPTDEPASVWLERIRKSASWEAETSKRGSTSARR